MGARLTSAIGHLVLASRDRCDAVSPSSSSPTPSSSAPSARSRAKRQLTVPVPRTLTALAEIATAIATGDSVGAVVPGVLSAVATQLDGTQATLWLRGLDGLRRAWSVAQDPTTGEAVADQLERGGEHAGDGFVAARLIAGRQELGALTVRPGRELSGEDAIFVSAIADLLAPALRDAEYAHRLESEVAARTREI